MPWEYTLQDMFLRFFSFTQTAGWIILAVLILRAILYRVPRKYMCLLWFAVLLRLICPVTIETEYAVVPQPTRITYSDVAYTMPTIETSLIVADSIADNIVNPILEDSFAPTPQASVNPMQIVLFVASILWVFGIVILLLYTVISWISMRLKLREAVSEKGYYQCANIDSPFVFGVLKPKIYLPYGLDDTTKNYVLLHEQSHIRRGDFLTKPLFWIAVVLHWINPLVWIAWYYFCRDLELACDEHVVDQLDCSQKGMYADTLLQLAVQSKRLPCPVAFGNNSVKQRIVHVLQYRKFSALKRNVILVGLILVIVLLSVNPLKEAPVESADDALILQALAVSWAETYANRDGQGRYDLLNSNWKKQIDLLGAYENLGEPWIPYWTENKSTLDLRGSSPWVKDWTIQRHEDQHKISITYEMQDSSGETYIYEEMLTFDQDSATWKVANCSVSINLLRKETYLCVQNILASLNKGKDFWRFDPISVASKFIEDYLQVTDDYLLEWEAEENIVQCHSKEQDYMIYLYQPIQRDGERNFYAVSAYQYNVISENGKEQMYHYYVADNMLASLHLDA